VSALGFHSRLNPPILGGNKRKKGNKRNKIPRKSNPSSGISDEEDGKRRGGDEGGDRGEADQRGVQDLEEEHPLPLRSGHHARPRVAVPHRRVAAGPRGASRKRLLGAEDDSWDAHLRERAQLPHASAGPAAPRRRRE